MALTLDVTDEKRQDTAAPRDQTEGQKDAVRKASDWFERDKAAKEPIMEEMEEDSKLYRGDHWDLLGPTGYPLRDDNQKRARANVVENVAFALVEGLTSEFAQDVDLIDTPVEKGDDEAAGIMTDLKEFIAYKNRIRLERLKWLRNLFGLGTGIWEHVWDPKWSGGRGPNRWLGEVRWRSLHPQAAYPDARCKEDIHEGRRFHKAVWVPIEHIRERYPEWGELVQAEAVETHDLIGLEDDEDQKTEEALEDQVLLVETWYIGKPLILGEQEKGQGTGLHCIWWAGQSQKVYLKHANYIYFEPGETPRFPFTLRSCYPRANSVWGLSEMHFLKMPQIALNKTAEIVMEGHMHQAVGQTFYESGALTPKQEDFIKANGTIPGGWFAVEDINKIKREFGEGVPPSVLEELQRLQRVMETIIGRFDISQGRTPGSVTAFRALDLLAQRAQVRLRSKEEAMTSAYEDVGNFINLLIWQNYNETRSYRILGKDKQDPVRYGKFTADDHKRVYFYALDQSVPYKGFQAPEGMEEGPGKDYEIYAPEFDVQCRVSTALPTDRVFFMEMAKELYAGKLIDEETFFYVMERGKFPPFDELMAKAEERAQALAAQQQQAVGQPAGQPGAPQPAAPAMPPGMAEEDVAQLLAQLPEDAQNQFNSLPPELQAQFIQELMAGGEVMASAPQPGNLQPRG